MAPADAPPAEARTLGDALKISFRVLRVMFALLLVAFLLSGVFTVDQNEVAVRTAFGRITGGGAGQGLAPGSGPYFRWPSPVGEVVRVPTVERLLRIDQSFVFRPSNPGATLAEAEVQPGPPDPAFGFLLTGDRNIVYARYDVLYRIRPDDVVAFLQKAGPADPAAVSRLEDEARIELLFAHADQLVRAAVEEAVVVDAAGRSIDAFRANRDAEGATQTDTQEAIRSATQRSLDSLEAGIEVTSVTRPEATVPPSVRAAFNALNAALQLQSNFVSQGQAERVSTLTTTAGEAGRALLLAIDAYDVADAAEDAELIDAATVAINTLLAGEPVGPVLTDLAQSFSADDALAARLLAEAEASPGATVGGTAFEVVRRARGEATVLRSRAESLKTRTLNLLPAYEQDPVTIRNRLVLSTLRELLGSEGATVEYLPDTERVTVQVPPDAERQRDAERRRLGLDQQQTGGG